jgi:hypothetical protein
MDGGLGKADLPLGVEFTDKQGKKARMSPHNVIKVGISIALVFNLDCCIHKCLHMCAYIRVYVNTHLSFS